MVDVHGSTGFSGDHDGFGVPLRLYNVLLGLAGRLDDSALSEARELVARSHLDDAAELTVGSLIAGRIPVRPSEQRELAQLLEMTRSEPALADQLTVVDDIAVAEHRFSRENEPDAGIGEALDRVLRVLPDLRSVHAVWRNTPAGSVPGPLPQRVVLVDIGPEAHPPAVAFRVADALRKAGIAAVVEVTGAGSERTSYHEGALSSGVPVWLAGPDTARADSVRAEPARSEPARTHVGPASVPAPPEPEPEPEPVRSAPPAPEPAPASSSSWTAEPPRSTSRSRGEGRRSRHSGRGQDADVPESSGGQLPAGGDQAEQGGQVVAFPQPSAEAEEDNRSAQTTEMSREDVAQLRAAIAQDKDKGMALASADLSADDLAQIPDLNLDDPQLTDRDRKLLRELHAELAQRERAEAERLRSNGTGSNG